jgi:hypothetical protein
MHKHDWTFDGSKTERRGSGLYLIITYKCLNKNCPSPVSIVEKKVED